jgi:hypothetical protein
VAYFFTHVLQRLTAGAVFDFHVSPIFQSAKMKSLKFSIKHSREHASNLQIKAVQDHCLNRMLSRTVLHGVLKTRQVNTFHFSCSSSLAIFCDA